MTPREKTKLIAKAIKEINSHDEITDGIITKTCKKWAVDERFIRIIGDWKKGVKNPKTLVKW